MALSNLTLTDMVGVDAGKVLASWSSTLSGITFDLQWRKLGNDWPTWVYPVSTTTYELTNLDVSFEFRVMEYPNPGVYLTGTYLSDGGTPQTPVKPLYSRQLTYKEVRDEVVARYYTATTPSTAELDRLATYITSANRMALQGYAFGEQWTTMEVDCANGKVLWADIYGADHREFYTADPRPADSRAIQIQENQPDADGVWLESGTLTTVWAKFVPRFPIYTNTALVNGTSYGQGAIGFVDATGHCYECIAADGATGAEYADTDKWRSLPLLWIVAEPIKGFAEASLFARSQERGQAATIRAESQATLDELRYHDCGKLNQHQS